MFAKRPVVSLALVLAVLAGCTLSRPLAHHAVSYNRAVELAQNRMLLLNIVRASQRKPMYFTRIGSVTASLGYELDSGSLTISDTLERKMTLIKGAVTAAGTDVTRTDEEGLGLPSVSYSNKPTFQVGVQDDHEFMRGTLTEISPAVFGYYARQGWPADLLLYLLVEHVELDRTALEVMEQLGMSEGLLCKLRAKMRPVTPGAAGAPGKVDPDIEECVSREEKKVSYHSRGVRSVNLVLIENDPEDFEEFEIYSGMVKFFMREACYFEVGPRKVSLGSVYAPSAKDYIEAHKANLGLEKQPGGGHRVFAGSTALTIVCPEAVDLPGYGLLTEVEQYGQRIETTRRLGDPGPGFLSGKDEGAAKKYGRIFLTLRSPRGAVYYLGEVLRRHASHGGGLSGRVPEIRTVTQSCLSGGVPPCRKTWGYQPMLTVNVGPTSCKKPWVGLEYEGETYAIPNGIGGEDADKQGALRECHPGRSMQALTLVSQLLALQQSSKNLPGTALVQVVGN